MHNVQVPDRSDEAFLRVIDLVFADKDVTDDVEIDSELPEEARVDESISLILSEQVLRLRRVRRLEPVLGPILVERIQEVLRGEPDPEAKYHAEEGTNFHLEENEKSR